MEVPAFALQRIPVSRLQSLERARSFRARHVNLFPTPHSWKHFVQSRREELLARGLLVRLTTGNYVDGERLDAALPELMSICPPATSE